jgi:enoyl-CoA hydratase/carnithine racemase
VAGAKFTTVAPRIGLPAEYGMAWLLPRLMGATHAMDVLLTGRVFLAEEAREMGFVNAVFAQEEFAARVAEIARNIARNGSPRAMECTKRQVYGELMAADVGACVEDSKRLIGEFMRTPDFREGVAAQREKRQPQFGALDPKPEQGR